MFLVGIDRCPYDLESYVVSSDFAPWNCHLLPGFLGQMRQYCNVSSVLQENAGYPLVFRTLKIIGKGKKWFA
jgi:hypothetical protein